MSEKSDKDEWTQKEMLDTFANTCHERHSIMVGIANGLSLGRFYKCPITYIDEEAYYALGWSIGQFIEEILIRLSPETSSTDTKVGIGQIGGVATLIGIIAYVANIIIGAI